MTRSARAQTDQVAISPQTIRHLQPDSYDAIARSAGAYLLATEAADLSERLGASEDVLRARLALAECLMDVGWRPTDHILAVIHRDEELLLQSNGALDPPLHVATPPGRIARQGARERQRDAAARGELR
jgi:hypothetical protein